MDDKTPEKGKLGRLTDASITFASISELTGADYLEAGTLVRTLGYHESGDGGGGEYLIKSTSKQTDGGAVIDLRGDLQAHLIPQRSVNYAQFGAVGDGENDDGVQIKRAHRFANKRDLPVVNQSGEYWILDTYEIPVRTGLYLGTTTIHIDEQVNTERPRFHVKCQEEPINLSDSTKQQLCAELEPGTATVDTLAPYKNCFVRVLDRNDRIGYRRGYGDHDGWAKEDFFYVEEHGRIPGDICWSFDNLTDAIVYPVPDEFLTVRGGTFLLSGDNAGDDGTYKMNGFRITRSRMIIENQFVGLEPDHRDTATDPIRAFYALENVYDVTLENIRLFPREMRRHSDDELPAVPSGTYGIGGSRVLNGTFRNVSAEGSRVHWGVFGTNLFKNFHIENCQLNRIDVHFHCHNMYVDDSRIGQEGLTLTGSGDLFINQTTVTADRFVNFRRDYGGTWNGDIRINNCTLQVTRDYEHVSALKFSTADFDYGYDVTWGRSIIVDDFTFDFEGFPESTCIARPLLFSSVPEADGRPIRFPERITLRNICTTHREKGVQAFKLESPHAVRLPEPGGTDAAGVDTNATLVIDNVDLESFETMGPASDASNVTVKGNQEYDDYAWYPQIKIVDIEELQLFARGVAADIIIRDSHIDCIAVGDDLPARVQIYCDNCLFAPSIMDGTNRCYDLQTDYGVRFAHCTWDAPRIEGRYACERIGELYDAISPNEWIRFQHIGSRLTPRIYAYYEKIGDSITPEFLELLAITPPRQGDDGRVFVKPRAGPSDHRPTQECYTGEMFFDTDLDKPIFYSSKGNWVDASGKKV